MRGVELVPDRARPGGWTLRVDGTEQSYVVLDDPLHLEFEYVRRMADVLDVIETPDRLRVVHVGGAAMTLPRYVAATRPGTAQVVLEPDEELTDLVRARLPLPDRSGIKVRPVGGRAGIAAMRDDWADVVVLDAFDGAQVPAELVTREFLADVARVLVGGGLVLLNLADRAPFPWLRRVLAGVGEEFGTVVASGEPATLKGRRSGNVLLVASTAAVPWRDLARRAAGAPLPYRVLDPRETRDRFGGGTAFSDADTAPSPAPPGGAAHFG
ncbi:hypothetical protein HMPREF0063_10686 [Aeromicrobium marinum DSM 15272]|uniref:Spermidine synthase n=1 Tax=Aeromicrobium marinum DSM 15272 TaxID=585531 RepID=E2S9P6_9ACTN|nr:fused MFS/spermidine synthase [Aeromicrobium marinum]EFQ83970.1 hypothetical protein HMPREF0063_10686 [Aeromicrobium marinum DSM 15272]